MQKKSRLGLTTETKGIRIELDVTVAVLTPRPETLQLASQISPSNSFQAAKVMESRLGLTQAAGSHWRQREKDRADRGLPSLTHWHESQGGSAQRLDVEAGWLHYHQIHRWEVVPSSCWDLPRLLQNLLALGFTLRK